MWAEEFTGFLLDFGFTQSITDRRLFPLTDEGGLLLVVGTFVDDFKVVVQSESNADKFTRAWEERYRDPPDAEATARDFLGLKYTRDGSVISISCNKATDDLAEKLNGLGPRLGAGAQCTTPLPEGPLSAGWSSKLGPTIDCCPTRRFPERAESWGLQSGLCAMPDPVICRLSLLSPGE